MASSSTSSVGRKKSTDNTVFVRFVPPTLSREDLQNLLSTFGPIRKCSIIRDNKQQQQQQQQGTTTTTNQQQQQQQESKGFGFVKFISSQDAKLAVQQYQRTSSITIDNSQRTYQLTVQLASSSSNNNSNNKNNNSNNNKNNITTVLLADGTTTRNPSQGATVSNKSSTTATTTAKDLRKGDDDDDDDYKARTKDDAQQQSSSNELLVLAKQKRHNRVMVRNVSFAATQQDIRKCLEHEFGPIVELTLPTVIVSKTTVSSSSTHHHDQQQQQQQQELHRGFCFVTFQYAHDAQRAVQPRTTPLIIKNRPVAIDFALTKQQHHHQQQQSLNLSPIPEQNNNTDDDDAKQPQPQQQQQGSEEEDESSTNDSDEQQRDDDDDDDDHDNNDDDDDDDDSASNNDDGKDNEASQMAKDKVGTAVVLQKTDHAVSSHCSLFVRNLPFDVTRHDLFQLFSKFGYITSIHLVKDNETGTLKGTAFVAFQSSTSAEKALQASGSSSSSSSTKNDESSFVSSQAASHQHQQQEDSGGSGLYLQGRRLFVDLAVDKQTAASLKEDTNNNSNVAAVGKKDRRNLYLKMEGRVESSGTEETRDAWECLPETDQLKRQRAFAEKTTKLRSPLFFINSRRLSIRNLAKHVDEVMLKKLCVTATQRGLAHSLVTEQDQVAHWRASGEWTTRDIMNRVEQEKKKEHGSVIPDFDEGNIKRFIPSVFIDRDVANSSRGFGFVDFEHHAHALACLRELNNNPFYTAEYVAGGKKAVEQKRTTKTKRKDAKRDGEFVNEQGHALIPRLIVDFTVENKAKARKQAEHRAQQQANTEKQRLESKEKKEEKAKKQKKSRGAAQREKKRKQRESGEKGEQIVARPERKQAKQPRVPPSKEKVKLIKPPKKKRKIEKEEQDFDKLIDQHRDAFSKSSTIEPEKLRSKKETSKRWFE